MFVDILGALFSNPYRPLATLQGLNGFGFDNRINHYSPLEPRKRCPLCDSSVYSYCGEKLFHDSCCCSNPNNPYEQLPHQCIYADCSFLHSNSCYEHSLITSCCCVKK
ncbi:hypothetical protein WA026_015189 [Henosepilachna vigintioctopunctata]|uniref:CCC domain-containing protein n=1 Tax=Henosepilachna vigintioctopunctata TaxID=420089 RepID=A0AAW1TMF9_9CUCU